MEIEYELTLDDLLAFGKHAPPAAGEKKPDITKLPLFTAAIMFGTFVNGWFFFTEETGFWHGVLFVCFCFATLLCWLAILLPFYNRWSIRKYWFSEKGQAERGRCKAIISPDGFYSANPRGASLLTWKSIPQICTTKNRHYFYTSAHQAIIVPRHAFRKDADFEKFGALAKSYHERAASQSSCDHSGDGSPGV